MSKGLLIGGGILVMLALGGLGVWSYLVYSGTAVDEVMDSSKNPFAEGGIRDDSERGNLAEEDTVAPADAPDSSLKQLSTRRTAGAVLLVRDGRSVVRFTEAGTGHLFEVPVGGGTETRISNTTFPQAFDSVWSQSGTRVVVMRTEDGVVESFLGSVEKSDTGEAGLAGTLLPPGSHSFSFNASGDTLSYALTDTTGTRGIKRELKTGKETTLFSSPLRDVTVSFNPEPLLVTKASSQLMGYAYRGSMTKVSEGALGLRALADTKGVVLGGTTGRALRGWIVGTTTITLDRGIAPDKCTLTSTAVVCGIPNSLDASDFPDAWYRGEVSYSDDIWAFDRTTGVSRSVAMPERDARRPLDVARFERSTSERELILTAKDDRSLWLLTL